MKIHLLLIALILPWGFGCANPSAATQSDPLHQPSFLRGEWVGYFETSGGSEWDAKHRESFQLARDGDLARSQDLAEISLADARQYFGPNHVAVAAALNSLSYCHDLEGRHDLAIRLQIEANDIWQQTFGPDHPDLALGLENLGYMYAFQSDFDQAEAVLLRALAINQQHYDSESDVMGMTYHHLGMLYRMMEDHEKAFHYRALALPIAEKYLGPNRLEYSKFLVDVAKSLQNLDRFAEAEELVRQLVTIHEQEYGLEDSSLAPPYFFLAELLYLQDQKTEAKALTAKGLALQADS